MKRKIKSLSKKYSEMSGDKKIQLGMNLSKMVRTVRSAGRAVTGA